MELNERILEAAIMNELVRDQVPVTVFLTNGFQLRGVIARYMERGLNSSKSDFVS